MVHAGPHRGSRGSRRQRGHPKGSPGLYGAGFRLQGLGGSIRSNGIRGTAMGHTYGVALGFAGQPWAAFAFMWQPRDVKALGLRWGHSEPQSKPGGLARAHEGLWLRGDVNRAVGFQWVLGFKVGPRHGPHMGQQREMGQVSEIRVGPNSAATGRKWGMGGERGLGLG
jgi:hypothetical protein